MILPDQRVVVPADTRDALDAGRGVRRHSEVGARHAWDRPAVRIAGGFLLPVLIVITWQIATTTGFVAPYLLPSPESVFSAGVELAERGQLWTHIAISVQRVLLGFAIGSVIGLVIAGIVGLSRIGDVLLSPTLSAVRAVPSLAWVPLLILWMQIGEESKVTLIAIGAFFPVYTTVASALRHVDPQLVEAGRSFSLRGWSLFRTVQLPAVVPSVVAGLRLALAQAWLFLVAAELIASSMGLGFLLTDSQNSGRVDRIILSIVLLALLGTITNALLVLVEKYLLRRWV
ncbi:ABC transporter permease [Microbacterium sp. UFMG61]|uniref:ABC transporter permease n=1 Tax=Microbacterium sp. UFMG61 TaxID=2745935 RepID=UPI001890B0B3|nr:ABC transporter permease [Microbacterium sp. UFMG61]